MSQRATEMTKSIHDQVTLTPDQNTAIYDFNMDYLLGVDKLSSNNLSDGSYYVQRNQLNKIRMQKIEGALTEAQKAKLANTSRKQ